MGDFPAYKETPIRGLLHISLDIRPDNRGWFEEIWQQQKWTKGPLNWFRPVQGNASFNEKSGTTRGLHAEPWNKLVTCISGQAFCAWVDLRSGSGFGTSYFAEMRPGEAFFVPKGVANGYQALEDSTSYSYLVDGHWRPGISYPAINVSDPDIAIPWPIEVNARNTSDKDQSNADLRSQEPLSRGKMLIVGGDGQVGRALLELNPEAEAVARGSEIIPGTLRGEDVIVNAAAFTAVDDAELIEKREDVLRSNYSLVVSLCEASRDTDSTIVHFSSDYVIGSNSADFLTEDEQAYPDSVYAMSKLLGDYAASNNPKHYIIRTSWVYGIGSNFIATMLKKAMSEERVDVVADQFGRPTSSDDLAKFTTHLINSASPFGTYNFSGAGEIVSWYEIAKFVYSKVGSDVNLVQPLTSKEFYERYPRAARRPTNSRLDLSKAISTGFTIPDWNTSVGTFLDSKLKFS